MITNADSQHSLITEERQDVRNKTPFIPGGNRLVKRNNYIIINVIQTPLRFNTI